MAELLCIAATLGLYKQAFRFSGDDVLLVPESPMFDVEAVTMMAWVRPLSYDRADPTDRSIIMNRERSYEYGLEVDTGAMQAAFNTAGAPHPTPGGCWRWAGSVRIPLHEWTHTAYAYDQTDQIAFVSGTKVESDPCGGGALVPADGNDGQGLRIGSRSWQTGTQVGRQTGADETAPGYGVVDHSQFQGDIDEVQHFAPKYWYRVCFQLIQSCRCQAMLFGAALSQAQVFSIYHRAYDANSGGAGVTFVRAPTTVNIQKLPSGLVGYWPLDGDGKDVSGNKLSGKPINADWVAGLSNLGRNRWGLQGVHLNALGVLLHTSIPASSWSILASSYRLCLRFEPPG
jgi:hypothetical protein